MRIRALAWSTFASLLRNKLIILFFAAFVCIVLLMMTPLLAAKAAVTTGAMTNIQAQAMVLGLVTSIMSLVTGFGSLLATWASADVLSTEMRSGTILAIMARPVRRWEFLLGKFLGVQLLMIVYIAVMLGLSYLLAFIGGEGIQSTLWVLIVYPLVRYAVYSAIAMLLVTALHPIVSFAIVLVIAVLASVVSPPTHLAFMPQWLEQGLYAVLPSTDLLSETRFLTFTKASLQATAWSAHLTALAYGLDYALVFFLLAVWSFRKRALSRI